MSKALSGMFGELAEALEAAGAAARKIEDGYANAAAKSGSATGDAVAGGTSGSEGKKTAATAPVAAKTTKGSKAKTTVTTFDAVKAGLTELMNAKGKDAVKSILSEYGAAKLADLEEDSYTEVLAKAKEAAAEQEEAAGTEDPDDMFGD